MGVQAGGGHVARLSIELVAEIARLQDGLRQAQSLAKAASEGISRSARAANDNLASMGQGANIARNELVKLGAASKDVLTRIEAITGQSSASFGRSAADIAAYGAELDRLRGKYNPVFAVVQQYKASVADIRQAHAVGAISAKEMADAISLVRQQSLGSIAAIKSHRVEVEGMAKTNGAARAGMQQLSMQLNDMATMFAMGANPMQIFSSQAGQVIQSLQLMSNGTKGLLGFLGGPWGMVMTTAAVVLAPLISSLLQTRDAAKQVEFATSAMGNAQSILGSIMDLTTGKIKTQSAALIALAKAQALAGYAQAQAKAAEARGKIEDLQDARLRFGVKSETPDFIAKNRRAAGLPTTIDQPFSYTVNKPLSDISKRVLAGKLGAGAAVDELEKLRKAGKITGNEMLEALEPIANLGVETENIKIFDDLRKGLNGSTEELKQFFNTSDKVKTKTKGTGDVAARAADRLREFGERSSESIQRISERFDAQPKLIDQVAQATRDLDGIMADLTKRKPPGFENLIADAQAAKLVVQDALNKPFRDYMEDQQRSMDLQKLALAGREDEARVMQEMWRLQDQIGTEEQLRAKVQELTNQNKLKEAAIYQRMLDMYPQMRAQIAANIEKENELNDLLEKRQAIIGAYNSSISSVRSDLEGLLGGQMSGKDFLKNLKQNFKQLQGKLLTEQLFGGPLRALEDQIRKSTVIDTGVADLKTGMSAAGSEANQLATAFANLRGTLMSSTALSSGTAVSGAEAIGLSGGLHSHVQALSPVADAMGTGDQYGDIVVVAKKVEKSTAKAAAGVTSMSPDEYFDRTMAVVTSPLADVLKALGIDLSNTLSGAMSGYARYGTVGGIVGGLQGLVKDHGTALFGEEMAGQLGEALQGVMASVKIGTTTAGVMKMLGIKTSTTGAQLGGIVGGLTPLGPLGSVLGSIAGGLIGGMLKKTKWARADISSASGDPRYRSNSGKYEGAVSEAASSVIKGLNDIAQQLGGVAGEFGSIALGVRDGNYRVNVNGTSLKKSGGAKDFGEDGEAAVAYAIQQAIKKGAISGINQSVLNLLQASGDFEAQLSKAVQLQNIFAEVASAADPMGYELEQLAKKFTSINALLAEANATPEEVAQVAAYQAQQAAAIQQRYAEEAAAKRATQLEKEAELLLLQGKATQALAKQREAEISQMDASLVAIQKQIYAETDAATRRALQIQLLEAQGNAEAAKAAQRAEELRSTEDVNKALTQQIWLTQDLRDAYDRQADSIKTTVDEMKGLGDTLKEFRKSIYSADETAASTTQAMAKLMTTGALAATGDKTALGDLSSVGRDYLDAAKASAGSMLEYQRAQALVANYADKAIAYTDNAVSEGEQQLALMKSQAASLISIDEQFQSFEDAMEKLIAHNASVTTATSAPVSALTEAQNRQNERLLAQIEKLEARMADMAEGSKAMQRAQLELTRLFNRLTLDGSSLQVTVTA